MHFKPHSLKIAKKSMMCKKPRFLQIDAVAFARAGPACSREPTESQDFLHLLRGSDLAARGCIADIARGSVGLVVGPVVGCVVIRDCQDQRYANMPVLTFRTSTSMIIFGNKDAWSCL